MPTIITITEADVGNEVASSGIFHNLVMKTAPTPGEYRSNLTFANVSPEGIERIVFNVDITTSHFGVGSNLASGDIDFTSLVLKNIPAGSSFEMEITPPPTLVSLSPNTAVSGDPDFTLSCIGTDFAGGTVIVFGQNDEPTTLVSDTEVTTVVKPSLFTPAVVPVRIRDGGYNTDPVDFIFTEPEPPPVEPPPEE